MNSLQPIVSSKHFKTLVTLTFFTLSAIAWLSYHLYSHYYVSTEDAYINANIVQIAPRVTGKVSKLYVNNNQYVKKGDVLFDIDSEPFQLALNAASAQLTLSNAELDNAKLTQDRTLSLLKKKFLSQQDGDNAVANYKIAQAKVEQSKANLAEAELNLSYTEVKAPTSGWITNVTLRNGSMVPANQPLFALISDKEFWADANFKETEMAAIKAGQVATIVTDLYPNHPFKSEVESISGGAGSAFSLLPPQNASGNWVKVTQRIPVRVRILATDPNYPLRIGISATVKIHL